MPAPRQGPGTSPGRTGDRLREHDGIRPHKLSEATYESVYFPITIATVVVPEPPILRVAIFFAPSIWYSPAFPVTCLKASSACRVPVAPTGCPQPMSPPLALIGSLPPNSIVPSSTAFHDSP